MLQSVSLKAKCKRSPPTALDSLQQVGASEGLYVRLSPLDNQSPTLEPWVPFLPRGFSEDKSLKKNEVGSHVAQASLNSPSN